MTTRKCSLPLATAGSIALLALASSGAGAAKPVKGAHYSGQETGCEGACPQIHIHVRRSGKKLDLTMDDWSTVCESTGDYGFGNNDWESSTYAKGIKVRRKGRFSVKGTYTQSAPDTYGGPAKTGKVHFKLKGRFKRRRKAVGTTKVTVVGKDSNGDQVDRCTTTEHWKARKKPS